MKKWTAIIFLLAASGCFEKEGAQAPAIIEITEIAREAYIPRKIMTDLEAELSKEATSIAPIFIFTPLQIQFKAVSEGVLKVPALIYKFPKGGGVVDLKDVVTGAGSFYLNFPPEQFDPGLELMHLYYLSNSPVRKIDGENFGLGCGKMLDLKKNFSKLQKPEFLKLNTTGERYVSVVAGRYVFIFRQNNQIHLTQLTIRDSRFPQQQCAGEF